MKVDLTSKAFFKDNEIQFDKKINFVFGKNGCGKSTITSLIKEQYASVYDIRIFDGFEGVVSENKRLETVILGEENTEINYQIIQLEEEIRKLDERITIIDENISESEENHNNLWRELQNRKSEKDVQEKKIDNFCTESARRIKEDERNISSRSYNIRDFKNDIEKGRLLSDDEITQFNDLIKSDVKDARKLHEIFHDLREMVEEVNGILVNKIKEEVIINRFNHSREKKEFAELGLRFHQVGEYCAFCGGMVTNEVVDELKTYFSASDVKRFQKEIEEKIQNIKSIKNRYISINIDLHSFYSIYMDEIDRLSKHIKRVSSEVIEFLDKLEAALSNKKSYLFSKSEIIITDIPEDINKYIQQYNDIVNKNNDSDLPNQQREAKEKLRFHLVKTYLNEFRYGIEKNELENKEKNLNKVKEDIRAEESKKSNIKKEIENIRVKISELQASTRNEKNLVDKINKILKVYASFELIHQEGTNEYQIKCKHTNQVRTVTELSTGEKNVLAFLYFIEKLRDNDNEKYVIFDDPMNSNDDTFQYLIINQLQKLLKNIQDDKIIILTHNAHFYLNVKYGFDNYSKSRFIRLVKLAHKVELKILENREEDFKTNYQALWYELKLLFDRNDISPDMILNPIRRIIETYIKFNNISKTTFYEDVEGASKLFDVNSHSIDDLEADLNGKTKEEILCMMEKCFENNNAINHFNQYWK